MTLEPDAESSTLKAEVTLEPMPTSRTSVHQKAARIQVTFADQTGQIRAVHEADRLRDVGSSGIRPAIPTNHR